MLYRIFDNCRQYCYSLSVIISPPKVVPPKRDLNFLHWPDLKTDEERIEFLESGRAYETGLVSQTIVQDLIEVFEYRLKNSAGEK